jgi:hypothetical protein
MNKIQIELNDNEIKTLRKVLDAVDGKSFVNDFRKEKNVGLFDILLTQYDEHGREWNEVMERCTGIETVLDWLNMWKEDTGYLNNLYIIEYIDTVDTFFIGMSANKFIGMNNGKLNKESVDPKIVGELKRMTKSAHDEAKSVPVDGLKDDLLNSVNKRFETTKKNNHTCCKKIDESKEFSLDTLLELLKKLSENE